MKWWPIAPVRKGELRCGYWMLQRIMWVPVPPKTRKRVGVGMAGDVQGPRRTELIECFQLGERATIILIGMNRISPGSISPVIRCLRNSTHKAQ